MNHGPQDLSQVFHLDVTPGGNESSPVRVDGNNEAVELLRQLVASQDRQNELIEELVDQMSAGQRQRAAELGQWKEANPILARRCRAAAEALGQVQTEFIENLTCEINDNFRVDARWRVCVERICGSIWPSPGSFEWRAAIAVATQQHSQPVKQRSLIFGLRCSTVSRLSGFASESRSDCLAWSCSMFRCRHLGSAPPESIIDGN